MCGRHIRADYSAFPIGGMLSEVTTESAERKIVLGLHIGVVAVIVCPFLWRIFGIPDPAHRFFDDFFYYLLPAEHWVDGAGSTFFPGEPTNGYHPLWFLWVALLYRIAGESGIFFGLLDLSLMALLVGFYFLFERFLRRVVDDRLAAAVGAGVAGITLALLAESGLETALTVFAAALLLCYLSDKPLAERTVRDAAVVGLLGAFLVLSRLDAAVLLFGLAVLWCRAGTATGWLPWPLARHHCTYTWLSTCGLTVISRQRRWKPRRSTYTCRPTGTSSSIPRRPGESPWGSL
jgi:hypothetical protein